MHIHKTEPPSFNPALAPFFLDAGNKEREPCFVGSLIPVQVANHLKRFLITITGQYAPPENIIC